MEVYTKFLVYYFNVKICCFFVLRIIVCMSLYFLGLIDYLINKQIIWYWQKLLVSALI